MLKQLPKTSVESCSFVRRTRAYLLAIFGSKVYSRIGSWQFYCFKGFAGFRAEKRKRSNYRSDQTIRLYAHTQKFLRTYQAGVNGKPAGFSLTYSEWRDFSSIEVYTVSKKCHSHNCSCIHGNDVAYKWRSKFRLYDGYTSQRTPMYKTRPRSSNKCGATFIQVVTTLIHVAMLLKS